MDQAGISLLALTAAVLAAACSPLQSAGGADRLLIDPDSPRYGRVVKHAGTSTVPITRGDGIAEFFVPVRIGNTNGWWQIDTGAALCAVTTRTARKERFQPVTEGKIMTAAGSVDSQLGLLPSVRLGGLEIHAVTALALDDDYADDFTVDGKRGRVLGILGADLLEYLGASIDLRAKVIRFRLP